MIPRAQARPQVEEPRLELGPVEHARIEDAPPVEADREDAPIAAPLVRRVAAGVIDVVIIGAIDLAVLYFTLKLCGLEPAEVLIIPAVPFLAFLVLLNGGYFVAFTAASGQTIGKMAAGLKVVPSDDTDGGTGRVPLGHAVVRTAGYFVSVFPAGLGMLPALFSADGRTLHDRLAGTRVILVS